MNIDMILFTNTFNYININNKSKNNINVDKKSLNLLYNHNQ